MNNQIKKAIQKLNAKHSVSRFSNVLVLDKIPNKKEDNIRKSYGEGIAPNEEILLVYDATFFGKADEGFAITERAIYYNLLNNHNTRRRSKISMNFILDSALGKIGLDLNIVRFNKIGIFKVVSINKQESEFLQGLFNALSALKPAKNQYFVNLNLEEKISRSATLQMGFISPFNYFPNGDEYFGDDQYGIMYFNNKNSRIRYVGKLRNGKFDGDGYMEFRDGQRYEGEWKEGKKHGKGNLYLNNVLKYEGEWKKDQMDGKGIEFNKDGTIKFKGAWLKGEYVPGSSILTFKDGKYDGEIKNGKRQGKGLLKFNDGNIYDGEWKDDLKDGQGILYNAEKSIIYKGTWQKDAYFTGKGTLENSTGQIYTGDFKEGKYYGKGILLYSKKDLNGYLKFEGEFKNGKFDGQGILEKSDGKKYEGEWRYGKMHGNGILFNSDGTVNCQGKFEDDYFMGRYISEIAYNDGKDGSYSGGINLKMRDGSGVMNYSGRSDGLLKFEGEWERDKPIKGRFSFSGNGIIEGSFFGNEYNTGTGKIILEDGVVFEGSWSGLNLEFSENKSANFLIPEINSYFIADSFENSVSSGDHLFVTESNQHPYRIIQVDKQILSLIDAAEYTAAESKIEEFRKLYFNNLSESDQQIEILNRLKKQIQEKKNEKLQQEILSVFGESKQKVKEEIKPATDDEFDDFA